MILFQCSNQLEKIFLEQNVQQFPEVALVEIFFIQFLINEMSQMYTYKDLQSQMIDARSLAIIE
jgi:hypothetical protein